MIQATRTSSTGLFGGFTTPFTIFTDALTNIVGGKSTGGSFNGALNRMIHSVTTQSSKQLLSETGLWHGLHHHDQTKIGKIDASNGGVFSALAYRPMGSSIDKPLGPDWHEDTTLYTSDAVGGRGQINNQVRVFVNDDTHQVVFAFKGTNNVSNGLSDVADAGASAYASIHDQVMSQFDNAKNKYPGYSIVSTGHSLGGGMAQSFSLEAGVDGFGQNSLPIPSGTLHNYFGGKDPAAVVADYRAKHHFIETNVAGDIATFAYQSRADQVFLDAAPTTLPSALGSIAETGRRACVDTKGIGCAIAVAAGVKAHRLKTEILLAHQYEVGRDGHLVIPAAPPSA